MDPTEFITIAGRIAGQGGAAGARSAATVPIMASSISPKMFSSKCCAPGSDSHGLVRRLINSIELPDAKRVSHSMGDLHGDRIKADYRLSDATAETLQIRPDSRANRMRRRSVLLYRFGRPATIRRNERAIEQRSSSTAGSQMNRPWNRVNCLNRLAPAVVPRLRCQRSVRQRPYNFCCGAEREDELVRTLAAGLNGGRSDSFRPSTSERKLKPIRHTSLLRVQKHSTLGDSIARVSKLSSMYLFASLTISAAASAASRHHECSMEMPFPFREDDIDSENILISKTPHSMPMPFGSASETSSSQCGLPGRDDSSGWHKPSGSRPSQIRIPGLDRISWTTRLAIAATIVVSWVKTHATTLKPLRLFPRDRIGTRIGRSRGSLAVFFQDRLFQIDAGDVGDLASHASTSAIHGPVLGVPSRRRRPVLPPLPSAT